MGTLVGLTQNTVTTQGFQLESQQDMLDALTYLSGRPQPYTGGINCHMVEGTVTWWLVLVNPNGVGSPAAYVGDWIILENGVNATVCKAVDFPTFYTVTTP